MYGYGNSMFLATHGILARSASGGGVDPDAQAFITAASITDPTQQSAINQLVLDLKGYSIWTKMKALYPFVGGTASAHKFNLKDPRDLDAAFRLVFSGGWTHSSTGALPNGTNAYADTKFNPVTNSLAYNDNHLSYYSRTQTAGATSFYEIGSGNTGNGGTSLFLRRPDNTAAYDCGTASANRLLISPVTDGRGFYVGSGISTNVGYLFKNGVQQQIKNPLTSASMQGYNYYIGGFNEQNSTVYYSDKQVAFSSIGNGLTTTEMANFYTAAQAFVTNAGIVDQVEANAINNLVIGMKADGLWTKMKAVYPMVGGTATSNSYNLKNTAQYQITWSGGVTHSSSGAKFGGVNGFGNTNLNGLSVLTQDSTHLSFYSRTQSNGTEVEIGAAAPANGSLIEIRTAGTTYFRVNSSASYLTYSDADSRAFYIANRTASNVVNGWRNSTKVATGTTASSSLYNFNLFLGALNENGNAIYYTTKECAFASIGDGLTDTDATNLNSRVTTFQTVLNRNV